MPQTKDRNGRSATDERTIELTDPRALRAVAHPIRLGPGRQEPREDEVAATA